MRKSGILEGLAWLVISLFVGAKTRVRVDYELSEEFVVEVMMHKGSVMSPFLFALVVDIAK